MSDIENKNSNVVSHEPVQLSFAELRRMSKEDRPSRQDIVQETPGCDHTTPFVRRPPKEGENAKKEQHYELTEQIGGSWEVSHFDGRQLVGCKYCPKFYGYIRHKEVTVKDDGGVPEVGYD